MAAPGVTPFLSSALLYAAVGAAHAALLVALVGPREAARLLRAAILMVLSP